MDVPPVPWTVDAGIFFPPSAGPPILAISLLSLYKFMKSTPRTKRSGMLLTLISVYAAYGAVSCMEGVGILLIGLLQLRYNGTPAKAINDWSSLTTFSMIFWTTLTETMLALDRVLIMLFPMKYAVWKVSKRLSVLTLAICTMTYLPSFMWFAASILFNASGSYEINRFLFSTQMYFIAAETGLHLAFLWFFRKHNNSHALNVNERQRAAQTNHIILFQCATQTIFCLGPALTMRVTGWLPIDPTMLSLLVRPLFAINVILSGSFVLFKLSRKQKSVSVVASTGSVVPSNRISSSK